MIHFLFFLGLLIPSKSIGNKPAHNLQLGYFYLYKKELSLTQRPKKLSIDGHFIWGANTESIQKRMAELREESSMFNQLILHLEQSEYAYKINNAALEEAYGSYSSKNGLVLFEVNKMESIFFDATIIEEFVHAYQALYYNYTHGKFRAERQRKSLEKGVDYSKSRIDGILNWNKFGRKTAYIESEAKLLTFLIQHQTCSISLLDIHQMDNYNTGSKGRKIMVKYFARRAKLKNQEKMGHLGIYYIEATVFSIYQKKFIRHWKQTNGQSSYTKGYFFHKPEAINNIYAPIKPLLPKRTKKGKRKQ
jgi:hypothetical protein